MKDNLLAKLRNGDPLSFVQRVKLIIQLSIPAIMAQISSIVMEYIDAAMVGRLGAEDSAAIGLVASSTWLLGGLCSAASAGFMVQVAQLIGAKEEYKARGVVKQGLISVLIFSSLLMVLCAVISFKLPVWLGGDEAICANASKYFLVFVLSLPVLQINGAAGGMIQCSGNMKLPSILHITMCALDVVFNMLFIFPSRTLELLNVKIIIPGLGLGVMGAALGTALSEAVIAVVMLYFLLVKSSALHIRRSEHHGYSAECLKKALKISIPVGVEQIVTCGALIVSTRIVAPLGTVAIAANSFSVTAESLCYMPGYGIGSAATTLIGQSTGAGRKDLTKKLGWLTTGLGMAVMTISGVLMYIFAPFMIGLLSTDAAIRQLGTRVLRIEAFAEPMYAASIVAAGVFRGCGDTLVPSILNFISLWLVRLPLSALLAPVLGLEGVWIAMCIELCVRGALFLIKLAKKKFIEAG